MDSLSKPTPLRVTLAVTSFASVLAIGLFLRSAGGKVIPTDEEQGTVQLVERDPGLHHTLLARSREGPVPALPGRIMEPVTR